MNGDYIYSLLNLDQSTETARELLSRIEEELKNSFPNYVWKPIQNHALADLANRPSLALREL